jgi:tetratricopeptide (TPR) repeat protein
MFHRRAFVALSALLLGVAPAHASKEWYDHYREGLAAARRGACLEAIRSFQAAVRLKPGSGLNERTYGMDFVDSYLPYYQQGLCQLRLGDHNAALQMFNVEEKQGSVKRADGIYRDLVKQRTEAQRRQDLEAADAERQKQARAALEEVRRLRREGDERYREGRLDEALTLLVQAQKAAELLDAGIQQQVMEKITQVKAEQKKRQEQAERAQRIETALAEGRRLLDSDQPAEARLRFDEVLALDPRHAGASEGKRLADERQLALTTRQEREAAFREGQALFEAGQYDRAQSRLAVAASDPANTEAAALLKKAQRTLERMREQKELRVRIDAALADGERLLDEQKYPEAMVRLASALEDDPSNLRAQERLREAERMTGDVLFDRIFPNQPPAITFFEQPSSEVDSPRLPMMGMALDDRGLKRIEYRAGGQVVGQIVFGQGAEYPRMYRVEHVFALEPGANQLSVAAVDTRDKERVEAFTITRRLRFYETRAFMPSAAGAAAGLVGLLLASQRIKRRRALRRRFNPYIAGAPVLDDDMFFGRRKLLLRILNVLHHNSLMITGERRIGKTTFLYHLKKQLEADEGSDYRFFPVFTDLQGVTEGDFFHALMTDVVEALPPAPATRELLRFRAEEGQAYDGRDFSHDLQRMVEELKGRTARQVKLVLLIDEVDVLNEFSERVNQRLRSIFMKTFSEHLVAVMSGVGIKRIWTSEGSPWYNFFDEIELSAFTREEAEALIREPVEDVFRWEPEAVERILTLSHLKPYLIQKFCIHAVNRMLEERRTTITAADVQAVRDTVLFEVDPEPAPGPDLQVSAWRPGELG